MATAKGRAIADYAISKIGCAYIYGGYGEKKCTPSFRKERASAYPDQKNNIYSTCKVLSGKQSSCTGCKWDGKQSYDCAQLTRYSCKAGGQELCSGANSQWTTTRWDTKGAIDSLPDAPGVILYHANSSGRMTHTGVYIGDGYAVEARAAKYGVVKTVVKSRTWTHWAALPGVLTGSETGAGAPVEKPKQESTQQASTATTGKTEGKTVMVELRQIKKGSECAEVKTVQRLLNAMGYDCGTVDGIFGSKTLAAVKAFQQVKGLDVDGIVGKDTWSALLK